jgi:hypothetical protein
MTYDDWKSSPTRHAPSTGPRREPEPASDYRGMPCHRCGLTMHRVYTLADVGAFCSPGCRQKATEPAENQGAA